MPDLPLDLPLTIGAALRLDEVPAHRDWLFGAARDVELQDFHAPKALAGDLGPVAERARRDLDGLPGRLGIHGPFQGFSIASDDTDIRAVVARRMEAALGACETIGADWMVIHSPFNLWDEQNSIDRPGSREATIGRAHETLREAVQRAEAIGTTLVIEDVDPYARVELARSFDSERVKVSIDTGHAAFAHGSTGAPPVVDFVQAAGGDLAHVHLQDADGWADRHWAIGEGTIPWPAIFRALGATRSNPRIVLELRDKAGIPASFDYLRRRGLAE